MSEFLLCASSHFNFEDWQYFEFSGGIKMSEIIDLIGNIGFTGVICLLLLKNNKEENEMRLNEMKGFMEAINNNTLAIEKLSAHLKKGGE